MYVYVICVYGCVFLYKNGPHDDEREGLGEVEHLRDEPRSVPVRQLTLVYFVVCVGLRESVRACEGGIFFTCWRKSHTYIVNIFVHE